MSRIGSYLKRCNEVYHTTFDPNQPGVVRIHLVPPAKPKINVPWVVIINGYSVIPLQSSWAILLKEFIQELNKHDKVALTQEETDEIVNVVCKEMKKIFPSTEEKYFKEDLITLVTTFKDIAYGKEPSTKIGYMTLSKYAKFMRAPHRMDLMVSAMERDGKWHCNQKCQFCYAAKEVMSSAKELTTDEWKEVIDKLKKACIPAITFTGGEATLRSDLVELVEYSKWFVTRLNTNGILLSEDLCKRLYDASLDSVQITLYSNDSTIHNTLVGGNHFDETIKGIKNAVASGLDVSINTPLCTLNKDYVELIKMCHELGIHYFSCSGLIPTGNAKQDEMVAKQLTNQEITAVLAEALQYSEENDIEISFTSPGWIDEKFLREHKIVVPSCGACLSNMAVAPNGDVIPCQSWLNGTSLGNLVDSNFKDVWKNSKCKGIRNKAASTLQKCLLKEEC